MERSAVSIAEQETSITWSRGDKELCVYTSDVTMMTKLDKLVSAEDSEWRLIREERRKDGRIEAKFYSAPVGRVSFRAKQIVRELTDEQREEMGRRLRETRTKKTEEDAEDGG